MKTRLDKCIADTGKCFILTKKGSEVYPLCEQKEGFPIPGMEEVVPRTWVEKGYVVECD